MILSIWNTFFAQVNNTHSVDWGIGSILIAIVAIGAAVALMYIALKAFGIKIPDWAIQCFWVVVVAIVVIFCIKFVLSIG